MEPEGSLPHSQVPATCPYLSQFNPVNSPIQFLEAPLLPKQRLEILIFYYIPLLIFALCLSVPNNSYFKLHPEFQIFHVMTCNL